MNFFGEYLRGAGVCYEPTTIIASLTAAAAIASAAGSISAGMQQQRVAEYNARVSQVTATEQQQASLVTAAQQQRQTDQELGQVASAFAAGGVDATGTPLLVMADTARQGELSRQLTLWKGQTQLASGQASATLSTAQGAADASAGLTKAGSTLLTGATQTLGPQGLNIFGAKTPGTPGAAGSSPAAP